MFITAVCFTYLMFHKVGFGLDYQLSVYIGLIITGIITILFFKLLKPLGKEDPDLLVNDIR